MKYLIVYIFLSFCLFFSCKKDVLVDCSSEILHIRVDSSKIQRKVMIIGVDGFRSDAMQASIAPFMYNLAQLSDTYYTSSHNVEKYTWSGPNWSSILTGVHYEKHNVLDNTFADNAYNNYPNFFRYIEEADSRITTVSLVNWTPINEFILSSFVDYAPLYDLNDSMVFEKVKDLLIHKNPLDPDVLFLHFDELDAAGHMYGFSPSVAEYINTINVIDGYIQDLFSLIEGRRSSGEDWLFFIISDHGGEGTSHSDLENLNVNKTILFAQHPVLLFRKDYVSKQPDIAATALDFLGIFHSEFNCRRDGFSLLD